MQPLFWLYFQSPDFFHHQNNFINPLLQVGSGSGSGSVEKITGAGSGGPKITVSDRIRILIPGQVLSFFWPWILTWIVIFEMFDPETDPDCDFKNI